MSKNRQLDDRIFKLEEDIDDLLNEVSARYFPEQSHPHLAHWFRRRGDNCFWDPATGKEPHYTHIFTRDAENKISWTPIDKFKADDRKRALEQRKLPKFLKVKPRLDEVERLRNEREASSKVNPALSEKRERKPAQSQR